MAKEPPARYPTACELGDDLRRWLRGESIRARPPGPIGRLARWCRRNARLSAMAAAVFGLLALLSAVSSLAAVRIAREQRRTLREHRAAIDHYRLALETLNSLVLDVNQKLGARPGTLPLKRDILETARAGLEKIARSSEAQGTVDRGAVVAYDQLGGVLFALGRTPEAVLAYERSRDLATALLAADPDSILLHRDLAKAHDQLGDMSRYGNDIPAAEAAFRAAIAVREALIARHGQYPDVLRDQCVSSNKIGLIHLRRGEYAEARADFNRGLGLLERYAPTYPSQTVVLADYEYIYRHLGQCCLMSDWAAGTEYNRKALEKARAFVAAEPENLWLRKKLAIDLDQLASGLILLGDLDGAEAHYREAQRMRQADLAAEPGDAENRRNVAVSHRMLGDLSRCRRDHDAASRHYRDGLSICEALAEADPGSAQKQGDVLETLGVLTDVADRAERYGEALDWLEKTRQRLDRLEREHLLGRAAIDQSRAPADALRPLYGAAARGMRWDATSPAPEATPPADLPPALHDGWRLLYATGLARRGRPAEAASIAQDVRRRHPDDLLTQLRCARVLALCAAAVSTGKPDSALPPDDRRAQESSIESSRDAVRRALRMAPAMAYEVFIDPDLEILRRRGLLEAVARELGQSPAVDTAR
jgi:tetratricopeptide (TPR) repeat protein